MKPKYKSFTFADLFIKHHDINKSYSQETREIIMRLCFLLIKRDILSYEDVIFITTKHRVDAETITIEVIEDDELH